MPALARGEMFSNPVFYFLGLVLPVASAITWGAVFHVFAGGLFTYLLLRVMGAKQFGSLVGAIAFAFNGYLIGWLSLPIVTGTMVWLPLVFLGVELAIQKRDWRWALLGSLGFTIQIYAGQILWPLYGAITLILFYTYRSIILWYREKSLTSAKQPFLLGVFTVAAGAALAAPQLLMTVELYFNSLRGGTLGDVSFLNILSHLPRLLIPNLTGSPLHGEQYWGPFNYTETFLYFGVFTLLFLLASLFSPKRELAWGLSGIGLFALMAVYDVFPFRQIVSLLYPVFLNTFPGRIFYVVAFTWSLSAGLGADGLVTQPQKKVLRIIGIITLIMLGIVLLIAGLSQFVFHNEMESILGVIEIPRKLSKIRLSNLFIPLIFITATLVLMWLGMRGLLKKWLFAWLCLILVISDLFANGINYNPTFNPAIAFPDTPSLSYLQKLENIEQEPYRIVNINSDSILPGMTPELYRLPTITGYSSWVLDRYSTYADLTQSRTKTTVNHVNFNDCCHSLLDALNIKYVYTSPGLVTSSTGTYSLLTRLPHARIETDSPGNVFSTKWSINGLSKAVLYQHPNTRITYDLTMTRPVTLKTSLGIDPGAWDEVGDGVTFEIHALRGGETEADLLFSRYLDPKHETADRDWIPVEVDLSPYISEELSLTLQTDFGPKGDHTFDWAGWAEPRLENYYSRTLELIYDGPNKIYKNTQALPRAWVVHQVTQVAEGDIEAVSTHLSAADFNPAREAVIEGTLAGELGEPHIDDKVRFISYSPEHLFLEADIREQGLLVLSDVLYPGWQAYVDGEEQPIITTNLIMRGVYLSGGGHQVEFKYRPVIFYRGLAISGVTLILIITALLWSKRRA
jgi:hypothetical protein